jgi:hypothetical protein
MGSLPSREQVDEWPGLDLAVQNALAAGNETSREAWQQLVTLLEPWADNASALALPNDEAKRAALALYYYGTAVAREARAYTRESVDLSGAQTEAEHALRLNTARSKLAAARVTIERVQAVALEHVQGAAPAIAVEWQRARDGLDTEVESVASGETGLQLIELEIVDRTTNVATAKVGLASRADSLTTSRLVAYAERTPTAQTIEQQNAAVRSRTVEGLATPGLMDFVERIDAGRGITPASLAELPLEARLRAATLAALTNELATAVREDDEADDAEFDADMIKA